MTHLSDRSQIAATVIIFCAALLLTATLWRRGYLQGLDFALYDWFLHRRPQPQTTASPIVLLGIHEEDIKSRDYPMTDSQLAQLLDLIGAYRPRVVGLDLYRDLPEPRSGSESEVLKAALDRHPNAIFIRRIEAQEPAIPPPPALLNCPERVGFNNFPVDQAIDNKMRRGLLFADVHDDGALRTLHSFPLRLALLYLAGQNLYPQPGVTNPEALRLGNHEHPRLRGNDGAYVAADDGGYQVLLEFSGPERFPTYTLSALLMGEIPKEALREKIVIIGTMTESVKDEFATPLHRSCYGVELHARLVDQLINTQSNSKSSLHFLDERVEGLAAIFGCGAGVFLGLVLRSTWLLIASVAAAAFSFVAVNQWGFSQGWWVPIAPTAVAFFPATMLASSYRLQREWRDRRLLMDLFSRHVSKEIADVIWDQRRSFLDGHRPRPQVLHATVLFTDLQDFTTIAATNPPSTLIHWLNQYLDRMSVQLLRRGGVINEYVGDGIMTTFGIPIPRTRPEEIAADAQRAVDSAVAMAEELAKLNALWSAEGQVTASMRVGIFTGPVVTGSIGTLDRLKYAVVGDTVNAASRLQSFDKDFSSPRSLTPRCRILVSDSTWQLLENRFDGESVGSFLLKGRSEEITIHQIFGRNSQQRSL